MNPNPGTYQLSPENGELLAHTGVSGAMARLGHELTLRATAWTATVTVGDSPESSSVEVSVDMHSLKLVGARGGTKEVNASDHKTIEDNAAKALQPGKHPELHYESSAITGTWEQATVDGTLTLTGHSEPQQFTITSEGDQFVLRGTITQTRYGLTPFSTMMGALKLSDDVEIEARATLGS